MRAVETKTATQATHKEALRPIYEAENPADEDEIKEPRTISELMSCWRSEEMLYPTGVVGSSYPNT